MSSVSWCHSRETRRQERGRNKAAGPGHILASPGVPLGSDGNNCAHECGFMARGLREDPNGALKLQVSQPGGSRSSFRLYKRATAAAAALPWFHHGHIKHWVPGPGCSAAAPAGSSPKETESLMVKLQPGTGEGGPTAAGLMRSRCAERYNWPRYSFLC